MWYKRAMRQGRGAWLGIAACLLVACGDAVPARGPNFVVIMSDDQTGGTLGVEGDPVARTPRLDRLAAEGVRFSNAFVTTSLCSPSRASYLTGQYVRRHGIAQNPQPLPGDATTYASLLRAAGYETAYVGKWHLGSVAAPRPGFDWTASFGGQGRYEDCEFWVGDGIRSTSGHVDDVSAGFAIDFLRRSRSTPFLLVVGLKSLHTPRTPPERFEHLYEGLRLDPPANADARAPYPLREQYDVMIAAGRASADRFAVAEHWRAAAERDDASVPLQRAEKLARKYYRSQATVDDVVGRLLDAIDELGLRDDTVVVYLSDNGIHLFSHGMVGKRSAYDESMRVEAIVRAPALTPGGRTVDELVLNVDLAPTLLDLAGVPASASMQGASWRPLLEGAPGVPWRDDFLYEYYQGAYPFVPTMFAVRTRTAKLVRYPGYPSWTELFDLEADPGETRNLATDPARAAQRARLEERLAALERALGPRLP
jgi:arylsulfatase A-like enzyme